MKVELLAYTRANPALSPAALQDVGDLATIWQGQGSFAENVIEYAGRVCYRSTHRMGTAPNFISARVKEGHEDIIEHVVVTLRIADSAEPLRWRTVNRHCEVSEMEDGTWIVSGNTRVWLDFFRRGMALEALPILKQVAGKVYEEFPDGPKEPILLNEPPFSGDLSRLLPAEDGPQRVTVRGKPSLVVMSEADYAALVQRKKRKPLAELLKRSPVAGIELGLERSRDTGRKVDL